MEYIKTDKLILEEEDLKEYGILNNYNFLRKQLYKAEERKDCILIQGAAFVVKGKAFLVMGIGGVDLLDSLAQLDGVDGIIGNGNTLFVSKDFKHIYSAHITEELIECYEHEGVNTQIRFLEEAPLSSLIFLLRSFPNLDEYDRLKQKKKDKIIFEVNESPKTFAIRPLYYSVSLKSRLRNKFLKISRVVHCARRPSLKRKECLFDSYDEVKDVINKFKGYFVLVYTLWNQEMCDAVGMRNTRKLAKSYNPMDHVTPYLLKIAENFIGD